MTLRTWVLGLALASTTVGAANESVSIRVSPVTSFAPTNLSIQVRVEPDANNRAIAIVADSADFFRSSVLPLEGDHAPKTTALRFLSVPPGDYEVTATLIGVDGRERAVARTQVNVLDTEGTRQ